MADPWENFGPSLATAGAKFGFDTLSQVISNNMNVDFWKMQNEYNTPKAQKQRLKEAGYNPALMYGAGTPASTISPARSNQYPISLSEYSQVKNLNAQNENILAQNELIKQQTREQKIKADIAQRDYRIMLEDEKKGITQKDKEGTVPYLVRNVVDKLNQGVARAMEYAQPIADRLYREDYANGKSKKYGFTGRWGFEDWKK